MDGEEFATYSSVEQHVHEFKFKGGQYTCWDEMQFKISITGLWILTGRDSMSGRYWKIRHIWILGMNSLAAPP